MSATKLWYPHYIEKYRRKTGHLTLAEHGAYRLLMDWYWDRRGPLPAKEDRLRRYLRADCREWRKIRDAVLEFFVLTEDGYRHEMIDETLAEAERQYEAKKDRIAKARQAKAVKRSSDNSSDDRADYRADYRDDDKPEDRSEINSDGGTPSPSSSHILTDTKEPRVSARSRHSTQSVSVSRETIKEPTPREILETVLNKQTAADVIEHRKRRRAPLTARAAKGLVERYTRCRDGPEAAAEYHITSGNQGFEPEWYDNAKRASNCAANAPRVADFVRELRISQEKSDDAGRESVHGGEPLAR